MKVEYLTPLEVAGLLRVTRRTVYAWIADGKLKAYHAGGMVRIKSSDITRFTTRIEAASRQGEQ